jgi:1-deoxy-D-xylulose-5-phosphate synthase
VPLLPSLRGPEDLRALAADQLPTLAAEIRDALVSSVAKTGGHLGPNLGCVELTIALHRVFDTPRDQVVWDVGHQGYPHKLLTGRRDRFETIRQAGGLAPFLARDESEHDVFGAGHASTSISAALGMAAANELRGDRSPVVALIGDGALTGGMSYEALNNIAAAKDRPVVIVVNDNGRSYSPTIGGVADALATLRLRPGYEREGARLSAAARGVEVVAGALRGERWVPRL